MNETNATKFHVGDKVRTNLSKNVFGTMPEMAEHERRRDIGVIKNISKFPSGEICITVMFDNGEMWNYAEENLIPVKPEFTLDDIKLFDIILMKDNAYRIALEINNEMCFARLLDVANYLTKDLYDGSLLLDHVDFDIIKVIRYKTESLATRAVMKYLCNPCIDFKYGTVMYDESRETKLKEMKDKVNTTKREIEKLQVDLNNYQFDLKKLEGE